MAKDIRVLVIKLADRLIMHELGNTYRQKALREKLERHWILCALAHRLGMNAVKWEWKIYPLSSLSLRV